MAIQEYGTLTLVILKAPTCRVTEVVSLHDTQDVVVVQVVLGLSEPFPKGPSTHVNYPPQSMATIPNHLKPKLRSLIWKLELLCILVLWILSD